MNDDDIKELLSKDSYIPKAPKDEWQSILKEVDGGDRKPYFWIGSAVSLCLVLGIFINQNLNLKNSDLAVEQFLLEEVLDEDDQSYDAWLGGA